MSFEDWLWCKWNHVCTKHMRKKSFGFIWTCAECVSEWHAARVATEKRLGIKDAYERQAD